MPWVAKSVYERPRATVQADIDRGQSGVAQIRPALIR